MRISDWSSDVCSSDLPDQRCLAGDYRGRVDCRCRTAWQVGVWGGTDRALAGNEHGVGSAPALGGETLDRRCACPDRAYGQRRSEERRVGKECGRTCRAWVSASHLKKKKQQTQY